MTPVTGRIAHGEEDRLVLRLCLVDCFVAWKRDRWWIGICEENVYGLLIIKVLPNANQSIGFPACCRRYGDFSSRSRLPPASAIAIEELLIVLEGRIRMELQRKVNKIEDNSLNISVSAGLIWVELTNKIIRRPLFTTKYKVKVIYLVIKPENDKIQLCVNHEWPSGVIKISLFWTFSYLTLLSISLGL